MNEQITTTEELEALPEGTIGRDSRDASKGRKGVLVEVWGRSANDHVIINYGGELGADSIVWPVTVLYRPDREIDCGHNSWGGLMALLDEHWPEDVFGTLDAYDESRDPGPRIVSLIRALDRMKSCPDRPVGPDVEALVEYVLARAKQAAEGQREHDLAEGLESVGTSTANEVDWYQMGNWAAQTIREFVPTAPPVGVSTEQDGYEPGRWWRVIAPDGSLWCETSNEREARERLRPGDSLQRQYRLERREWRDVEDAALGVPTDERNET